MNSPTLSLSLNDEGQEKCSAGFEGNDFGQS